MRNVNDQGTKKEEYSEEGFILTMRNVNFQIQLMLLLD